MADVITHEAEPPISSRRLRLYRRSFGGVIVVQQSAT
jgi:hypothetical protein